MPRIYFYCAPDEGNQQEDIVILAEGLRALGVPFSGNCDFWQESTTPGDFLIRHDPSIAREDCDVVVVSYTWPFWIKMRTFEVVRRPLPENLFHVGRRYRTVYTDNNDGYRTAAWEPEFRAFDVVLRSHMNRRAWYPSNFQPWTLGYTSRIANSAAGGQSFRERARSLLVNFGGSHPYPHPARVRAERGFLGKAAEYFQIDRTIDDLRQEPTEAYDRLMWRQTGGRHARAYFERLKRAQAVACFCGDLIPSIPFRGAESFLVGGNKAKLRRSLYEAASKLLPGRRERAIQWDSYRFWESLQAGCVAFHVDLELYGVQLPEMPINWVHYVGVDLDDVDSCMERIEADPTILERIAAQGREWSIKHYSPAKMAERFLASLGFSLPPVVTGKAVN